MFYKLWALILNTFKGSQSNAEVMPSLESVQVSLNLMVGTEMILPDRLDSLASILQLVPETFNNYSLFRGEVRRNIYLFNVGRYIITLRGCSG